MVSLEDLLANRTSELFLTIKTSPIILPAWKQPILSQWALLRKIHCNVWTVGHCGASTKLSGKNWFSLVTACSSVALKWNKRAFFRNSTMNIECLRRVGRIVNKGAGISIWAGGELAATSFVESIFIFIIKYFFFMQKLTLIPLWTHSRWIKWLAEIVSKLAFVTKRTSSRCKELARRAIYMSEPTAATVSAVPFFESFARNNRGWWGIGHRGCTDTHWN